MDVSSLMAVAYEYIDLVDLCYLQWLAWLFYPLVITFVLPICLLLLLYASAMFLHVYRLRHLLRSAALSRHYWDSARYFLAVLWEAQGKIWHGYEVVGFEKIPVSGPALLIYYHGTIPIDLYYVIAKMIVHKDRQLRAVGDRFLFKIPGFRLLMDVFCVHPGSVSQGVELMKDGHILAIAPGGVREAFFSDEYYKMLWGKRVGFAKIALEAKVPVIPMFTQNCNEAFRTLGIGRSWFRWIYEKTRLPIVPIYGAFPVKLRTYIGDPIPYDPDMSPDKLAVKVQQTIQNLIKKHQRIPGSIFHGLLERFPGFPCGDIQQTESELHPY
ncbi:Transmembrane protein 68 [Lamellibrachia satsuma]|nr:Transmembrane protein 68 [Lamellibrachia satsuma]